MNIMLFNLVRAMRRKIYRLPYVEKIYLETVFIFFIFRFFYEKYLKKRKTYSQYGEDLIIKEKIGKVNTFIDIGANDGINASNTFLFALEGARGICFEPVPWIFRCLKSIYFFNNNIKCIKAGISDKTKTTEIVSNGVLSYIPDTEDVEHSKLLKKYLDKKKTKILISLSKFDDVMCKINFPCNIDLLSIDVEGHELNVIKSIPFNKYKFKAIILETHSGSASKIWKHKDLNDIEVILSKYGYESHTVTDGNTIYINRKS